MKNFKLLLVLTLLCSCSGLKQIRIEEVRNVQLKPFSGSTLGVGLEARVNNPSYRKVQLTKLELNVQRGSTPFATISTTEKVKIAKRSNEFQPVSLEVRLRNVLSAIMAMQLKNFSVDDLTVEGEIKAKAFPLSKTIKIEKMSVREFASQYGDIVTPLLNMYSK
jgi:hypothetical protein